MKLVVGGEFPSVSGSPNRNIAAWDLATDRWTEFVSAAPAFQQVRAVAVMSNGDLVIGGTFSLGSAAYLAKWTGTSWAAWGPDPQVGGNVNALLPLPNGQLIVAGTFLTAGGNSANRIAKWDGDSWHALGDGLDQEVHGLARMPDGDIIAGGKFGMAGGNPAARIARWSEATQTWSPLGSGMPETGRHVFSATVLADGSLVAVGTFNIAGGSPARGLARWDGSAWHAYGAGLPLARRAIELPNGDLVATGLFSETSGGVSNGIARWSVATQAWVPIGSGLVGVDGVYAVERLPDGSLIACGSFQSNGSGGILNGVARWNDAAGNWRVVGAGLWGPFPVEIRGLAPAPDGGFVAVGTFSIADGSTANNIARWNGQSWLAFGSGLNSTAYCARVLSNGDVVAGGPFTTAGGVPALGVARWSHATGGWSAIGGGLNGYAAAVWELANGDLVVGGDFTNAGGVSANRIARWNGNAWTALGTGLNSTCEAVCELANGDIVAGGTFTTAGGVAAHRIARWDGVQWTDRRSHRRVQYQVVVTNVEWGLCRRGQH